MKQNLELKIQAWLDGELSDRQAEEVAAWVARDAEASQLVEALGRLKQTIAANQPVLSLPETREFYWSKIERQIRREEAGRPALSAGWAWRRWLMPIAGVATLAAALLIVRQELRPPSYDEISATDDGMEAVTFHDQAADVTVVWLQDRNAGMTGVNQSSPPPVSIPDPGESEVEVE